MIQHIHILHGPNLNLLGKREPQIYGAVSFEDYLAGLKNKYGSLHLHYFQSNHEGHLIDYLQTHGFDSETGIILNAGGLTHTSISLRDAVASIQTPVIEVHISDVYQREPFRWHSYLRDVCLNQVIGKGLDGYAQAIDYLLKVE